MQAREAQTANSGKALDPLNGRTYGLSETWGAREKRAIERYRSREKHATLEG